jgi:DNA-binding HxlR family transcriptional regulator
MILSATRGLESDSNSSKSKTQSDHRPDRLDPIYEQKDEECSIQFALTLIQGKWKIRILSRLQHGPARFSQLRRMIPSSALKKELTTYLRELESAGLIVRIDPSGRMPYAEYSLSDPLGIAALHLISTLAQNLTG